MFDSLIPRVRIYLRQGLPFIALFVVVVVGSLVADSIAGTLRSSDEESALADDWYMSDDSCNVVGIEIRGCIQTYVLERPEGDVSEDPYGCDTYTSSEEVTALIDQAAGNDDVRAVLLEIDSLGGSPVAAEEIAHALKTLGKPSVAWIRGYGDSAAYWVASAAGTIVASENSDVGSIGVTSSYIDYAEQNRDQGLTYNQLVSGKYKDMGTTDRALTYEERALIQRDLDIVHENFIRAVSENRKLSLDAVRALADGSTMLGKMAKEKGLVDVLGTKDAVWDVLSEKVGDQPNICW